MGDRPHLCTNFTSSEANRDTLLESNPDGLAPLVEVVLQPLRLTLLQYLPLSLLSPQVLLQQQRLLGFLLQPLLTFTGTPCLGSVTVPLGQSSSSSYNAAMFTIRHSSKLYFFRKIMRA